MEVETNSSLQDEFREFRKRRGGLTLKKENQQAEHERLIPIIWNFFQQPEPLCNRPKNM